MVSREGWERGETVEVGTRERKTRKIQNQTRPLLFEFVAHFQWSDNCNSSAWTAWFNTSLSKERECVSQLTSGQQDIGEKARKIDHVFFLHA